MVHDVPFQRSAMAAPLSVPTATHMPLDTQDTPLRRVKLPPKPAPGLGTDCSAQDAPFHRSAIGTANTTLPGVTANPTAMHCVADAQDTSRSVLI